ncbi:NAD-dependent epimerase/dehydratase family protein [Paenibacillus sp. FA6]|uniref:NAD-dependent epimerase/dehydratase family protein n=1 Tax=Paenibacillus sp. FA6 TaxID=3413029 RepID=UPI003F657743
MKTVVITGSEGKVGRYVVKEFAEHGYRVIGSDLRAANSPGDYDQFRQLNLNNIEEVKGLLTDADYVVHLAAVPNPINFSPEYIFSNNVVSAFNILEVASNLGIPKVVIGSSESAYGFCWAKTPFAPNYFPVDEQHPLLPQEGYGLSKGVNEQTGDMFHRRSGIGVYSLRFSHVLESQEYAWLQSEFDNTGRFHRILWSYIDARDAASACRMSIEDTKPSQSIALNITANDMMSDKSVEQLLHAHYSDVQDIRKPIADMTAVVSNRLAYETIGWSPQYSWQQSK